MVCVHQQSLVIQVHSKKMHLIFFFFFFFFFFVNFPTKRKKTARNITCSESNVQMTKVTHSNLLFRWRLTNFTGINDNCSVFFVEAKIHFHTGKII